MSKLTMDVPVELKAILERHPEIDWKHVGAKALWSYARRVQLADKIASQSSLTEAAAEAIGREVKTGLRRRFDQGFPHP